MGEVEGVGPSSRERGARLGPYELVAVLGAGASGEVWEAVLHGPGGFRKPVALKLLHEAPHPTQREAFLREARLGARLQHPNVVATLHVGEHGGTTCIALELVHGLSLDALRRHAGGRLPARVVLDVGVQVAAALHHVHGFRSASGTGLVHRDVKPANLLVDRTGLVKLADLGISVLHGEAGDVAGTPGFVAPEQLDGRPEPRSDLFSLGAVLYLVATAVPPFGRGGEALSAVRRVEAHLASARFVARVDDAVPGLGAIVRACLRADPEDRPSTAREVAEALEALTPVQPTGVTLLELLSRSAPGLGIDPPTPVPATTRVLARGNLPFPRDAFVGRAAFLADLEERVRVERWVVLAGPGGMGKTRLALEAARQVEPAFPGGAHAFDLTEARTVDGVVGAIASALGIRLEPADPVGQIGRVLAGKGRALVVLDNLEQCVDALPDTVGRWIGVAPEAAFLGTSRVVPGLRGEAVVAVGELPLADAATLFRGRAPRALTAAEGPEVEPLCRALEGMPLAIELAAARLRVLDVAGIRARLSLALLAGGGRERPERHRSVAASLAWSCDLLSAPARRALAHLSVFEGGFDLAAAETVLEGAGGPWALDVLQELADACLVRTAPGGRFSLGAVVGAFAAGLLTDAERRAAEVGHGAHYAQLGSADAIAAVYGPHGTARMRALALERDNVVAACRRAIERRDGPVAHATFAAADLVLGRQGPASLCVDLGMAVVDVPSPDPAARVHSLRRLGHVLAENGRTDEGVGYLEEAVARFAELGDRRSEAIAQTQLASQHRELGSTDQARALYERALHVHRSVGNRYSEATTLGGLGILALRYGNVQEAEDHHERSLAILRQISGPVEIAHTLGNLGVLRMGQGRPDLARALFEEGIAVFREAGHLASEAVGCANLGAALLALGRPEEARTSLEHALRAHREVGNVHGEAVVLANLGSVDLDLGRDAKARTSLERALSLVREAGDRRVEGLVLGVLGNLHREAGRREEALDAYARALQVARVSSIRPTEGTVLTDLGQLCVTEARWSEARTAFEAALAILREVGDRVGEGKACTGLACVAAIEEGPAAALALAERAEALLRASGAAPELAIALAVRAEQQSALGADGEARRALAEAETLAPWHARADGWVRRVRAATRTASS